MSGNNMNGLEDGKNYCVSVQGLQRMLDKSKQGKYTGQHLAWTDDIRVELPICVEPQGVASKIPITLIDKFTASCSKYSERPALSVKRGGKWQTYTYKQYVDECRLFGRALISLGMEEYTAINIIGFNAPEWAIAFMGAIFAGCIPVGVYTTNNRAACEYIVKHSQCQLLVAENMILAEKYLPLLEQGVIKRIILYDDSQYDGSNKNIVQWKDWMKEGQRVERAALERRMAAVRPGRCCTLVYTSGTTGMFKGVMISHDNYTWTAESMSHFRDKYMTLQRTPVYRMVSFLPLSHVAAQFSDLIVAMSQGHHVYFADPSALQGSLINTLKEVKPNVLFSVPRVWEKIYDSMMQIAKTNGPLKTKIATWAKSLGEEGTLQELSSKPTSLQFKLAKFLVFDNIKKALGLQECDYFLFGAAPLDPNIRKYFLSLNIFLVNGYGMSECSGPQNFSRPEMFDPSKLQNFKQVGYSLSGTKMFIQKQSPNDEDGQICYKGRNRFMGYFKNAEETSKAIDDKGYLHSGDNGRLQKDGMLFITGRAKELIITAGGQNIPPLLIEAEIRTALPWIANVMLLGEARKYLTCFITLRQDPNNKNKLENACREYLSLKGFTGSTVEEARKSPLVNKLIAEGIKVANSKSVSRAQLVQNHLILPQDFQVDNGTLTPTLKLKRKEVVRLYAHLVEQLYSNPSL